MKVKGSIINECIIMKSRAEVIGEFFDSEFRFLPKQEQDSKQESNVSE